jgi:outer membrane protein OmpA-like peptidoglycan-associated protein
MKNRTLCSFLLGLVLAGSTAVAGEPVVWRSMQVQSADQAANPNSAPADAEAFGRRMNVYDFTDRPPTLEEVRTAFYGRRADPQIFRSIRIHNDGSNDITACGSMAAIRMGTGPALSQAQSSEAPQGPCRDRSGIAVMVEFDLDSAAILPRFAPHLEAFGQVLHEDQALKITVVGHADSRGETQYNQVLSEKRALSVKQFLVQLFQIEPDRIALEGRGETELAIQPGTNSKNRRVEVYPR